jgi:hypothetical protein
MKTKRLICSGILAMAASFGAFAQDAAEDANDPTVHCNDSLAVDARFSVIADKMIIGYAGTVRRAVHRTATAQERSAVGQWLEARKTCFEAGAKFRRSHMKTEDAAYARSVFVFQQMLVVRLLEGKVMFADFNQQSLQLAAAAMQEDL